MNKGFTLVEIIATIVILCVIAIIVFPSFNNIIKKQEENKVTVSLENIYIAVENYIINNEDVMQSLNNPGSTINVNVKQLVTENYIKAETLNPITKLPFSDTDTIKVTKNTDGTFAYELMSN